MLFRRNRHFPMRRLVLLLGDMVGIAGAIVLAAFLRLYMYEGEWQRYLATHIPSLTTIFLIFLVVFYAGGLYERESLTRKLNCTVLPAVAVAIAILLSMAMFYARFEVGVGRGILLLAGILVFLTGSSLRHLYRIAVGYSLLSRNALIVGDGTEVRQTIHLLQTTEDSGFRVFGIVGLSGSAPGTLVEGVPVLGDVAKLHEYVAAYEIETLIVAASLKREPALLQTLRPLRYAGIELLDDVSLYEEIAQEILIDHIDDEWLMNAAMNSSVVHIRQIKRMMDVAMSTVGLILSAPLCLGAAVLIRLSSRGPVLYRQQRVQRGGAPFTLLKFRTMRDDAESASGAVWAGCDDTRVTRVGKLLRTWRIDEIPQLVNVLKGEMSLVGPRPERPELVETLAAHIPFYKERLLVLPGITGWAQIRFPYAASIEASRRKLQFDLYYSKHMGFLLDLQILLQTFRTILTGTRHSEFAGEGASPPAIDVLPDSGEDDSERAG